MILKGDFHVLDPVHWQWFWKDMRPVNGFQSQVTGYWLMAAVCWTKKAFVSLCACSSSRPHFFSCWLCKSCHSTESTSSFNSCPNSIVCCEMLHELCYTENFCTKSIAIELSPRQFSFCSCCLKVVTSGIWCSWTYDVESVFVILGKMLPSCVKGMEPSKLCCICSEAAGVCAACACIMVWKPWLLSWWTHSNLWTE